MKRSASAATLFNYFSPKTPKLDEKKENPPQNIGDDVTKDRFSIYDNTKRKRIFLEKWKEEFPWVTYDPDAQKMYCLWCTNVSDLADKNSPLFKGAGSSAQGFRKETLQTHDKSKCHKKCGEATKAKLNPDNAPMAIAIKKLNKSKIEELQKLFNSAYFLVTENLALNKFKALCQLQVKNGTNLGENYFTYDACKEFIFSIASIIRKNIVEEIKQSRFLCILADGSADKSSTEQEAVYVRYVKDGLPITKLANLVAVENAKSCGIHASIMVGLSELEISEEILTQKLVGLNLDGAASNMGSYNSVKTLMKAKYPEILVIHCINHNLELAILDSKNNDSYVEKFESTLKQIFSFYHFSPKRQRELENVANSLESNLQKFGGLQRIRWIASQHRALKALANNFEATVVHLEDVVERGNTEESATAKGLLKRIKSKTFKEFLLFLMDVVSVLTEMSESFQAEQFLLIDAVNKINISIMKLKNLEQQIGPNQRRFKSILDKDGIVSQQLNKSLRQGKKDPDPDIRELKENFLTSSIKYLEKRFESFKVPPLSLFTIFDFNEWPDDTAALIGFRNEDIESICHHFKRFFTEEEIEGILQEWPHFKVKVQKIVKNQTEKKSLIEVYKCMLNSCTEFCNILKIVELMMTLSSSTAVVERGFSSMNIQKNSQRSKIKQDLLNAIMQITVNGKHVNEFDATPAIEHWLNAGPGTRHIDGHAVPQKCK